LNLAALFAAANNSEAAAKESAAATDAREPFAAVSRQQPKQKQ
jgi:hypothetical protein